MIVRAQQLEVLEIRKIKDKEMRDGGERRFKNGGLRNRSRGSIFGQRWRCAWQFEEVLDEDFQVEEGRGLLQDGNDEERRGILIQRDCCMRQCVLEWHGIQGSSHR